MSIVVLDIETYRTSEKRPLEQTERWISEGSESVRPTITENKSLEQNTMI